MEKSMIQQLAGIKQRVERLIRKNQQLEVDQTHLKERVAALQQQKQELQQKIELLESQKKILKIAKGLDHDPKAKQEAKLKVNEFIKEIDKCIVLLQD